MRGLFKDPALYEAMYILDSALEEEERQRLITLLENHVTATGGEVIETREFSRRRLAYAIDNVREGIYMILYFKGFGEQVIELNREMRITDGIVRGMVVIANPKSIFDPAATAAKAAEEAAAAAAAAAEEMAEAVAAEEVEAPVAEVAEVAVEAPVAEVAVAEVAVAVEEPVAEVAVAIVEEPAPETEPEAAADESPAQE